MKSRSALSLLCLAALSLLIAACAVPVVPGQAGDGGGEIQEPAQTAATTVPEEFSSAIGLDAEAAPSASESEARLDRTHGAPQEVGPEAPVDSSGALPGTESSQGPAVTASDESGVLQGHALPSGQSSLGNNTTWQVAIFAADGQTEIAVAEVDASGGYQVFLPAGLYQVRLRNPAGEQIIGQVQVEPGATTTLDMNISANQ